MTATISGPALRLLSWLVRPHELAHYAVLAPWSRTLRIERSGSASGLLGVPLGRLAGEFSTDAPVLAVRLCALAPTLVFVGVAAALELAGVSGLRPATVVAAVLLAIWATPSAGDLDVFLDARAVRDAGSFETTGRVSGRVRTAADLGTVAITWLVALLVVG